MTSRPNPGAASDFGRRPLGSGSLTLSIAIHAIALVVAFWVPSLQPDPLFYPTVELRVMSTPPPEAPLPEEPEPLAPEDELVVETPEQPAPPEVAEEDPEPEPMIEEDPEPEPEPEPDSAETPEPELEEIPPPEEVPVPAESQDEEDEGVAELLVRQEGFKADYPEYYARMLAQVNRCLQRTSQGRTAQSLEATVRFVVERDGSTADFGVERSSGTTPFDIAVLGAIECAGMAGRLGPLPDDYPYEVLRITLVVSPKGGEPVLHAEQEEEG